MDTARFEGLREKVENGQGLSEDEANELGRMYAEEAGKPYSNADDVSRSSDGMPEPDVDEEAVKRAEESDVLYESKSRAASVRPAAPATLSELQAEEGLEHDPDGRSEG